VQLSRVGGGSVAAMTPPSGPLSSKPQSVATSMPAVSRPLTTPSATPSTTPPTGPTGTAFREEDLHFYETELARQIGPLARVIVKKAAKKAVNTAALIADLVENIPDDSGKAAFKAAVKAHAK
jgi:serine/threonine-protein kinase